MADLTSVVGGAAAQDRAAIDSGLAAIVLVARFHGIAVDPVGLRHQFGTANRPFSTDQILRATKLLNLKARALNSDWTRLSGTPTPAIAKLRNGRHLIVGAADSEEVLVRDPAAPQPATLNRDQFEALWTGGLILLSRHASVAVASGPISTNLASSNYVLDNSSLRRL